MIHRSEFTEQDDARGLLPAPKKKVHEFLAAVVPLLIVAASVGVYAGFGHRPPPPKRPDEGVFIERVRTVSAVPFQGNLEVAIEGVVRPFRYVNVAAEVAGRVKHKSPECEEATYIQRGTLLLEIDPTDYELAVRRHTNELAQTENSLKEWQVEHDNTEQQIRLAKEDVELTRREIERIKELAGSRISTATELDLSERAGITARNMLLQSQNQLRLLDARYDRAVSARDLQKVQLERAMRDLERTKIYAPCDGTIVTESVEEDAYVQAGSTVAVINDTSSGEVVCRLELEDMYWLWGTKITSDPASIVANPYSFPQWPVRVEFPIQDLTCIWEGEMFGYGGAGIDASTRTVPCQVRVKDPKSGKMLRRDGTPDPVLPAPPLTVGMYVTVRAQLAPYTKLIRIPADALRAGSTVCVVRNGMLNVVRVKVARETEKDVLIFEAGVDDLQGTSDEASALSLMPDDKVVVSPLATIREGMPVQEIEPAAEVSLR
jgi:multidrug efflux pump subunit AcrA (membrane-fusion protein)